VTGTTIDPEWILIRRVLPFAPIALAFAFGLGYLLSGMDAASSAALAIIVVTGFFTASGLSLAWAARISSVAVFAVGLGGYVVRLAAFLLILVLLDSTSWFSALAFALAFAATTIALLGYELRWMAHPKARPDLWYFREHA
jgi:hypothetical protein